MKHGSSIVIANWNVERVIPDRGRFNRISKTLSEIDSVIWFLTETHEKLIPCIGFHYVFSGVPDRDSQAGERWSAIWSRWPIENLDEYVTDKFRCAAGRIGNSPFGELIVCATVLPWATDPRGQEVGSFEIYKENLLNQQADWLRLNAAFPMASLIVAGDFNQSLAPKHSYGSKEKRALLEQVLSDSRLKPLTAGKNDPIFRDSPPNACIDHICVSTSVADVKTTERWPEEQTLEGADSDHFGVRVQIG